MKSILLGIRSKGLRRYIERGQAILTRYGLTPSRMLRALDQFSRILDEFRCGATFPITAIVVERNGQAIRKYMDRGIEFAIHGYRHIDLSRHTPQELEHDLQRARDIFASAGVPVNGFRSPYLISNQHLHTAARGAGLAYVSNQPILWDVSGDEPMAPEAKTAYERAIAFYTPWRASERLAVPRLEGELTEIPVSLPDDEILLDRLNGTGPGRAGAAWQRILLETHQYQELFTLQLHPERIDQCASDLAAVLAAAQALDPPVWIARLSEIAAWWRARSAATITATHTDSRLRLSLQAPQGTTLLARKVCVNAPTRAWAHGYECCQTHNLELDTCILPFIGVPGGTPAPRVSFLRQQGYIVQVSDCPQDYTIYLHQAGSVLENERSLIKQIEDRDSPLIKLGRWPNNACGALAITGDIDALTLWDYGLRYLGR
jgi:peptidoglycan/xylan/chitin deacetylase (PgdA/CDA1 family)